MTLTTQCVFCDIGKGTISAPIVFKDDRVFVINDRSPQAPVHLLVIPKNHFEHIGQAPAKLLSALLETAAKIAKKQGFDQKGYRLIINTGKDGGQEVPHIHIHVLAGESIGPLRT